MRQVEVEEALGGYVEWIEGLQPDPARLGAAVAAPVSVSRRGLGRRLTPLAAGLACLLLGVAAAAAATGWLDSALDSFFQGGRAPGHELSGSDLPTWLRPSPGFNAPDEVSEVAAAGDERLYAYRQGGNICFDYGHHVGDCRSPGEWRREFEKEPWIVVGPLGRSAWFGLVDANVVEIRIEYAHGPPEAVAVSNSGFVATVDKARDPQRMIGLDDAGEEVVSRSMVAEEP
jgi:hypothetical protein